MAGKFFVHEPADRLAVFQQERHVAAAHFQDRPSGRAPITPLSEAGVEEASVVDAKFANSRIDRGHFRRKVRGDLHALPRSQNIELVGIEDQPPILTCPYGLPKILDRIAAQAVDVDDVAVLDGLIADHGFAQTAKIDPQHHALAQVE